MNEQRTDDRWTEDERRIMPYPCGLNAFTVHYSCLIEEGRQVDVLPQDLLPVRCCYCCCSSIC